MKIYYFGELIEENGHKVAPNLDTETVIEQTAMELAFETPVKKKVGMDSIGDVLKELDLTVDSFRPLARSQTAQ